VYFMDKNEFPLKIENDEVLVDTGDFAPNGLR
jgi:hypothetical protein